MSEEVSIYGDEPTYIVEAPKTSTRIKVKKLRPDAVIPTKATPQSVGYDLYVTQDICIEHPRQVIPLGFAIELPDGIEAKIEARSGFSSKGIEGFALMSGTFCEHRSNIPTIKDDELWQRIDKSERFNADVLTGKIDPDYLGEVGVIIRNNEPNRYFLIAKGTRIAQMTFYPVVHPACGLEIVSALSETERSDGGFGHTGI
jgi:dUTP pyrophosphatase